MEKKHAYCIIAHSDRYCLDTLLELIDDERNDIYIHLDKKAPMELLSNLKITRASLTIIPHEESIDVRWGDLSLAEAELKLFEYAVKSKNYYSYIHLISGSDLPLRSQDEIHDFFANKPEGSNFIEITTGVENEKYLSQKTDYYHLFTSYQKSIKKGLIPKLTLVSAKLLRKLFIVLQKSVGYKRNWRGLKLARGINWVSISNEFAEYLVERKEHILKMFKGVVTTDEIYKQTMIINSPFDSTVYAFSRGNSDGIRLIDWSRGDQKGSPLTWTMEQWHEIENAHELFARKFSSTKDKTIIDKIKTMVKEREEKYNKTNKK